MINLQPLPHIFIKQRTELAEFIGFESRNKYEILSNDQRQIGFAAEDGKGIFGAIGRQFFGHWRRFNVTIFNLDRSPVWKLKHPFRWFFQRVEVYDAQGAPVGAIQQRFSIFSKKFDLENALGEVTMSVSSPFWRIWTFPFKRDGQEIAVVRKKWSGLLKEAMTDADHFQVEFTESSLTQEERVRLLAAGIFIDLKYFEEKAGRRSSYG